MSAVTISVDVDPADAGRLQALLNACLLLNGHAATARVAAPAAVPWHRAKELLASLREELQEAGLAVVHGADQMQAYATVFLERLEVDLRRPQTLYEALAVIALVRACARNGEANDIITEEVETAVASVCRALALSLSVMAPSEALT